MSRLIIPVVILLLVASGGFYLYQNFKAKPASQEVVYGSPTSYQTQSPISSPASTAKEPTDPCEVLTKGNEDVPVLYSRVKWDKPFLGDYDIPVDKDGLKKITGCVIKASNITDTISSQVRNYYNLEKYAWKNIVVADGVYSSTDVYQKGNRYFLVRRYPTPGQQNQGTEPLISVDVFYSGE